MWFLALTPSLCLCFVYMLGGVGLGAGGGHDSSGYNDSGGNGRHTGLCHGGHWGGAQVRDREIEIEIQIQIDICKEGGGREKEGDIGGVHR